MPSVRRLLGDAERVIEKGLHECPQEQFLIRPMFQPLDAGEADEQRIRWRQFKLGEECEYSRCFPE